MEIIWCIDDGFVNTGDHSTEVDDEEIEQCKSVEEAIELIDYWIQEDFLMNISWYYKNQNELSDKISSMLKAENIKGK